MTNFYADTVLILRPTSTTNRAQETVLDYRKLQDPRPWEHVHIRPAAQLEREAADRTLAVSEWLIASEPGRGDVDLLDTDVVQLPTGERARVIGDPARPSDPITNRLHHVEVLVRKAS